MRKFLNVILVSATLSAAACGGSASTPTSPSSGGGATSATSAMITGTVRNASSSGTVAVAGTAMTTSLDAAGRFTLSNVPTGDVQLHVSSGGGSATVPIAGVQPSQTIDIVVSVSGAFANVESEVRQGAAETELKGSVEAVPPATAPSTFRAAGKIVVTNASTTFVNGNLAGLTIGRRVEVKGTLNGDAITATRVEIEGAPVAGAPSAPTPAPPAPKPEPAEAEFTGTISALSGAAAGFQFTVGTRVVKGDSTTAIIGSSNAVKSFADLKTGSVVEVHGVQRDGFVQATRIKLEGAETEPGDDGIGTSSEAKLEGSLAGVSGTCPVLAASVGGTKFTTSSSTRFEGATCGALKNGDRIEVRGARKTDGSIAATRVEKK